MYNHGDSHSISATFLDSFSEHLCHCPLLDFWQKSLRWSESKLGGGGRVQRKQDLWGSFLNGCPPWHNLKNEEAGQVGSGVVCMNMKHKWNDSYHVRLLFPLLSWSELRAHIEIVNREINTAIVLTLHLVYQNCFQVKFLPPDSFVERSQPCGLILLFLVLLSGFIQPLTWWEIIPPFYSALGTFFYLFKLTKSTA